MKKVILSLTVLGMFFATSCSNDDDTPNPNPNPNPSAEILTSVSTDTTLDPSVSYKLTGPVIVSNGATLTIPAGTKIEASAAGTGVYLAVNQGAKIDIQGTAEEPVVMSSPNGNQGDWGGLTILGEAETTAGVDQIAEVGGFVYGGTDSSDSSGSIKYLVIKGTGASINPESEYNGISFYAVGSGTTVENIAVINGADDGIEMFGGSVEIKNVYLEDNNDDSVDWTEGWDGAIENVYIEHNKGGFSTAFEGDKLNNNPMFTNVTAISTVGGTALQFKKQSGATINNLYLSGYETNIDMKDGGDLTNVIIDGEAASTSADYNTGAQVDVSGWNWVNASL
ncbi:hypothetical protein GO491_01340 [Flavobacteriaceae bacterium Ap0902]|nr:hypothetical protein [Flavobacteriaceae bacterium Ap0902]